MGLEKVIRITLLIGGAICAVLFGMHLVTDVGPLVHGVILGVGSGFAMVYIQMQWGLVGEAIDYNEMLTGKRTEGSIYGTFNLSRRVGQTIGNSAAVFMLGVIGYNANLPMQAPTTVVGIKILCVLVPAVFILGSWAAFKFLWKITPETRAKIAEFKAAKRTSSEKVAE
jgi:GPH family glycoside/pentoside/hexuronide:cation symporter